MNFYLLLPVLTGLTIVSQATLNRMSAGIMGLATAILLNGIIFFLGCVALWGGVKLGWIPWTGTMGAGPLHISLKTILPGLCGIVIVVATPIALMHLGAALTFSIVIATQLFLGVLIDVGLEGKPLSWPLLVGAATVLVGCLLILNADKLK